MFDQVQNTMSNIENYRMAMKILALWETYRMTVIYVFAALLIVTIILFIMKNSWKILALILALLTGLTIIALDGFKMYVESKKEEAKMALVKPLTETGGNIIGNLLK